MSVTTAVGASEDTDARSSCSRKEKFRKYSASVAALLHNFLVDEREANLGFKAEDAEYFRNFSLREQDERESVSSEAPTAVVTDNNEPHPGGRPSASMSNHQARGKRKREQLTHHLYGSGRGRPMQETMNFNSYGQVYFTS